MITNRESLTAVTMYLSKEKSDNRAMGVLNNLKPGFLLEPLPVDAVLKILGNGKPLTRVRPDAEPTLKLRNEKAGGVNSCVYILYSVR